MHISHFSPYPLRMRSDQDDFGIIKFLVKTRRIFTLTFSIKSGINELRRLRRDFVDLVVESREIISWQQSFYPSDRQSFKCFNNL